MVNGLQRGDRVYDKADRRHVGVIRTISITSDGVFASVRWEETGWLSFRLPLGDLRRAPSGRTKRSAMFNMKRALAGKAS